MRYAIPVEGEALFPHFGRAKQFLILEIINGQVEEQREIEVEDWVEGHEDLAQLLQDHDVEAVIAGRIGPGALEVIEDYGIHVIAGIEGDVTAIIDMLRQERKISKISDQPE